MTAKQNIDIKAEKRHQANSQRQRDMFDFVPGSLEIQDKPPSPTGRLLMFVLLILFLAAIAWAFFGHIDIVATADGKIIPSGKVKKIQPYDRGVIDTVFVKEGDYVEQGQKLLAFDATLAEAESARLANEYDNLRIQKARESVLIALFQLPEADNTERQNALKTAFNEELTGHNINTDKAFHWALILARLNEYHARIDTLKSILQSRRAEQLTSHAQVKSLSQILPLMEQQRNIYQELTAKHIASHVNTLEAERNYLETRQRLTLEMSNQGKLRAAIREAEKQIASTKAEYQVKSMTRLDELMQQIALVKEELRKAKDLLSRQVLYAPVAGYVKQLQVSGRSEVVTPAQELMQLVPENDKLIVEALLANKDIGFVHVGDDAAIKVHTFPFTKYGTINGKLVNIGSDAIEDEKLGLVYNLLFEMEKNQLMVSGKPVDLVPGMRVSAEIKIGKRRVIEYFLAPLLRYKEESIRER